MNNTQIFCRILFWIIFYLTLQIFAIGEKKKYIQQIFYHQQCDIIQNIQTCTAIGMFNSELKDMQLEVNITISNEDLYKFKKTKLSSQFDIHNIQANLIIYSNNSLFNISIQKEPLNYEKIILNETINLLITCNQIQDHYNCLGRLSEINTNNQQLFLTQLSIIKPEQYPSMTIKYISSIYENSRYYSYLLIFQFIFTMVIATAIYYFFMNITEYNSAQWPEILKWIPYLLCLMIFYNLPIQLFRQSHHYFVITYTNFIQLLVQSSLFYFWLIIFEFQKLQNMRQDEIILNEKQLRFIHLLKIICVILYTIPQTIMNFYIFSQKQQNSQFNIKKEILFYDIYEQLIIASLTIYTFVYCFLLYKQFNYKQINIEPQITTDKPYEIFDEQEMLKLSKVKNYKLLHILSTICFFVLIYNQYIQYFQPQKITIKNTLNEWGLINIYICILMQLYIPIKSQQTTIYQCQQIQDNRINDQNEAI